MAEKLVAFGLTVNQAKTYLSIIQYGPTSVSTISKTTQLHRQDIYKMLPKLEDMGLITRTVGTPIKIEAIPVEKALNHLISIERQKANRKISHLKASLNALVKAIKKTQETPKQQKQEEKVIFLTTDKAIKHELDHAYENAKTSCDLVISYKLLMQRIGALRWRFQKLATNQVKTRLLFENTLSKDALKKILKELIPKTGDFTAKLTTGKITIKPYVIIDHEKVYVSTRRKTKLGLPCVLLTDSKDIVSIYEENFGKAWKSSRAIIIHKTTPSQKES